MHFCLDAYQMMDFDEIRCAPLMRPVTLRHQRIYKTMRCVLPLVFLQKAFYAYLVLGISDDRAR